MSVNDCFRLISDIRSECANDCEAQERSLRRRRRV